VTHFTEELDFLSAADLEWIMGRGLVEACAGRFDVLLMSCAAPFSPGR
jgi:hypothetical protein